MVRLYKAAWLAAFYTLDRKYVSAMVVDVDELARRGQASEADVRETYDALLGVRDFEAARSFAKEHGVLARPPVVVGYKRSDAPAVLSFAGPAIERVPVDLGKGQHLIVVGHPTCHFTQNAVGFIERDAELAGLFRKFAIWVAPQDLKFSVDLYRTWNADHPLAALSVVDERNAWPVEIDDWSTPTFYFIQDGTLLAKVVGWPKEGRRQELLDAFQASGMKQVRSVDLRGKDR